MPHHISTTMAKLRRTAKPEMTTLIVSYSVMAVSVVMAAKVAARAAAVDRRIEAGRGRLHSSAPACRTGVSGETPARRRWAVRRPLVR